MNAPIPPLQFDAEKRYASKLEAALDAARRGFRVFPLLPDSKKPPAWMTQWQYGATRDEAKIREWSDGKDWNIAGSLDGLGVADIDLRHGGKATFEELRTAERLDEPEHLTLVARTHSGGSHFFLPLPERGRLEKRGATVCRGVELKKRPRPRVVVSGRGDKSRRKTQAQKP